MIDQIDYQWDEEAKVWIATSPDIPGLILEHENKEFLTDRIQKAVPELRTLNNRKNDKDFS